MALFGPFGAIFWVGIRFKTFLEPTYVDNQLWFWKVSLIFSFLIWSNLGPFLNYFWAFRGYFLGWGQIQKNYCYLPKLTTNFGFGCTAISFCFQFGHIWGLFCTFLGPSGLFFWPFGAYCVVGVRFKNIFGTYLCRKSTLVLEIQSYLFVYNLVEFGAFFTFLGLPRLFLWLRSSSTKFLRPTYINLQLLFWNFNSILLL